MRSSALYDKLDEFSPHSRVILESWPRWESGSGRTGLPTWSPPLARDRMLTWFTWWRRPGYFWADLIA